MRKLLGGWPSQELSPLVPLKLSPAVIFNRHGSKHMSKNQPCADLRRGRSRSALRPLRPPWNHGNSKPRLTVSDPHGQSEVRFGLPMKVKESLAAPYFVPPSAKMYKVFLPPAALYSFSTAAVSPTGGSSLNPWPQPYYVRLSALSVIS